MIQIRNVPDDVHRRIKSRAALEGMSLSDYLLREIQRLTSKPTIPELVDRIAELPPVELEESAAETIRRMRGPI